jgi:hypothetical protein
LSRPLHRFNAIKFIWTLAFICSISTPHFAAAQDQEDALPARVPATGLAVLDCAPPSPAPEDSCLVRIPSDKALVDVSARDLTDEDAEFRIVRTNRSLPEDVVISSTLVLIDLSRGPNNARQRSWNQERDQIERVLAALPEAGEIAVYGFGAELQRVSGFSDSRSGLTNALSSLELTENNTILSTNVLAAIDLLSGQEQSLLKNLIIITDGEEEGVADADAINSAAAEAGVTLSALGMFWRLEGNPATSRGIDTLTRITRPQNGLIESVFLRNGAEAATSVSAFIESYGSSIGRSGVILPQGEAAEAEITVVMAARVPGVDNETRDETFTVKFTPASADEPPEDIEPVVIVEPQEDLLFGYPRQYVYIAGAIAALFFLLLLVVLIRRNQGEDDVADDLEDDPLDGSDFGGDPSDHATAFENVAPAAPVPPAAKAQAPVSAYLVREGSGDRLPIRGDRVGVGRSSTNGVVIPDHGISRVHAELHRNRNGGFSVTDLDSMNGTFVNDKKITGTVAVRIGDTLGFGKVRTKLVLP